MERAVVEKPVRFDMALSVFNAFLGIWLVASAFLWKHDTASRIDTVAVGLVCVAIALLSSRFPIARWLFVPLAAWMYASPWIVTLEDTTATVNLMAVATALLLAPFTTRFIGQDVFVERPRRTAGP